MKQRIVSTAILIALLAVASPCLRAMIHSQSKPEEIEWTWEARPSHADANLPNVLLEGDSLARNYYPEVQKLLAGKGNVYLMASSICVGDSRLPKEIVMFAKMEGVRFRVIHFNNGMHGIDYSEAQYRKGFPAYLAALHSIAPGGILIWATTTPLKSDSGPGLKNTRIDARNAIAMEFVRGMMIDDQHTLMEKHQDLYLDNVHFNPKGTNISAAQVADAIRQAMKESASTKR